MATIHQYDPRVDTTYVYESKKYYDREQHKSRTKRRLIGKLDKETGEIIPTGPRGRPPLSPNAEQENGTVSDSINYKMLYESYAKDCRIKAEQIEDLRKELENEKASRKECETALRKMLVIGQAYYGE